MGAVIEDVEAARKLLPSSPEAHGSTYSAQAYTVRKRVKRTGFNELRNAFLRFGGEAGHTKFPAAHCPIRIRRIMAVITLFSART